MDPKSQPATHHYAGILSDLHKVELLPYTQLDPEAARRFLSFTQDFAPAHGLRITFEYRDIDAVADLIQSFLKDVKRCPKWVQLAISRHRRNRARLIAMTKHRFVTRHQQMEEVLASWKIAEARWRAEIESTLNLDASQRRNRRLMERYAELSTSDEIKSHVVRELYFTEHAAHYKRCRAHQAKVSKTKSRCEALQKQCQELEKHEPDGPGYLQNKAALEKQTELLRTLHEKIPIFDFTPKTITLSRLMIACRELSPSSPTDQSSPNPEDGEDDVDDPDEIILSDSEIIPEQHSNSEAIPDSTSLNQDPSAPLSPSQNAEAALPEHSSWPSSSSFPPQHPQLDPTPTSPLGDALLQRKARTFYFNRKPSACWLAGVPSPTSLPASTNPTRKSPVPVIDPIQTCPMLSKTPSPKFGRLSTLRPQSFRTLPRAGELMATLGNEDLISLTQLAKESSFRKPPIGPISSAPKVSASSPRMDPEEKATPTGSDCPDSTSLFSKSSNVHLHHHSGKPARNVALANLAPLDIRPIPCTATPAGSPTLPSALSPSGSCGFDASEEVFTVQKSPQVVKQPWGSWKASASPSHPTPPSAGGKLLPGLRVPSFDLPLVPALISPSGATPTILKVNHIAALP